MKSEFVFVLSQQSLCLCLALCTAAALNGPPPRRRRVCGGAARP